MHVQNDRRQLLLSALGGGLALAGWPAAAAAATESTIYLGFNGPREFAAIPETLQALRGRYQPELPLEYKSLPGNASARALEAVHKGPADGSSVLLSPSGIFTLMPHLRTLGTLDPVADLTPVTPLGEFAHSFVVGPGVPAEVKTMASYFDWAREHPDRTGYGLSTLGTPPQLAGIEMARRSDIGFKAITYQGPVPMKKDLLAGLLPAAFVIMAGTREVNRDERFRQLAIAADKRWPEFPNLPTFRELGIAETSTVESWGFYVSARTPKSKVVELNAAAQEAMRSAPVADAMQRAMLRPTPMDAEQFAAALATERAHWQTVVKRERFTFQG